MKCNKCNSNIPSDSEFCPICGNKIEEIEEKKTISISFKKAVILFIIGIIIIGIVVTYIFNKKINNYSVDSNMEQESNIDNNYIEITVTNNKQEDEVISRKQEEFLSILDEDLNTICNTYLKKETGIKSFVINAMYNVNDNKFVFVNYVVNYINEENVDCFISSFRVDDTLVPYNNIENNVSTSLIPKENIEKIFNLIGNMSAYNFNDNCRIVVINGSINKKITDVLSSKVVRQSTKTDIKNKDEFKENETLNNSANEPMYMDQNGNITSENSSNYHVIKIIGINNNNLKFVKDLSISLSEYNLYDFVTSINISNINEIVLELEDEEKTVYLGKGDNLDTRLTYLKSILEQEKENTGKVYINGDFSQGFKAYFKED